MSYKMNQQGGNDGSTSEPQQVILSSISSPGEQPQTLKIHRVSINPNQPQQQQAVQINTPSNASRSSISGRQAIQPRNGLRLSDPMVLAAHARLSNQMQQPATHINRLVSQRSQRQSATRSPSQVNRGSKARQLVQLQAAQLATLPSQISLPLQANCPTIGSFRNQEAAVNFQDTTIPEYNTGFIGLDDGDQNSGEDEQMPRYSGSGQHFIRAGLGGIDSNLRRNMAGGFGSQNYGGVQYTINPLSTDPIQEDSPTAYQYSHFSRNSISPSTIPQTNRLSLSPSIHPTYHKSISPSSHFQSKHKSISPSPGRADQSRKKQENALVVADLCMRSSAAVVLSTSFLIIIIDTVKYYGDDNSRVDENVAGFKFLLSACIISFAHSMCQVGFNLFRSITKAKPGIHFLLFTLVSDHIMSLILIASTSVAVAILKYGKTDCTGSSASACNRARAAVGVGLFGVCLIFPNAMLSSFVFYKLIFGK